MDLEKLIADGLPIRLQGVSSDAYHSGPGISKSKLDLLRKGPPAALKAAQEEKPTDTPAMRFGRLVHSCVLEPDLVDSEHVVPPKINRRTKEGKEAFANFEADNANKTVHTKEDWDLAHHIAERVHQHEMGKILLDPSDGTAEDSYWWTDPGTGILCKCRPDKTSEAHSIVIDLKTAQDASREGFAKASAQHGYFLSDVMTRMGMEIAGNPVSEYVFFVVEKTPPYLMASYVLSDMDKSFGEDVYARLLELYKSCLISDDWPGYTFDIQTISMPRWGFTMRKF